MRDGIVFLHDSIFFYLIVVATLVTWRLAVAVMKFSNKTFSNKYWTHGTVLELCWTIAPAIILLAVAFPSFRLLYMMDEVFSSSLTVKVDGSQWYWSYELSDLINEDGESLEFDSYRVPDSDLESGDLRRLTVDNPLLLPVDTHVRFIVSARDVRHDFAVPSLGIKLDAVPGRLNQTSTIIEREATYYGRCSELCGVYHGFMPIVVEAVSREKFMNWLDSICLPSSTSSSWLSRSSSA